MVCIFGLASCAAEDDTPPASQDVPADSGTTGSEETAAPEEAASEAVVQAADCGWEAPRIEGSAAAPSDAPTNLAAQLVGAWQHTHFDTGSGLEAPLPDNRYVFPTEGGMLYCQDLPGVTDKAENATEITITGNLIQPPGGHPGFEVVAVSDDAMQWINKTDGSTYLLARR